MAFQVTYTIFDTEKGETPPESGEYNVLYENGEWARAVWDETQLSLSPASCMCLGEWKEWFGPSRPHLWAHKKSADN